MSRGGAGEGKAPSGPSGLVDRRVVKALGHVLRQRILLAAVQGEVSPDALSGELGQGSRLVGYHLKVLCEDCDGLIEESRTERRPGAAVERFYRASVRTRLSADAGRRPGPSGADG